MTAAATAATPQKAGLIAISVARATLATAARLSSGWPEQPK